MPDPTTPDLAALVERVEKAGGRSLWSLNREVLEACGYETARHKGGNRVRYPDHTHWQALPSPTSDMTDTLRLIKRRMPGAYWRLEALTPALQEGARGPFWATCGLPGEQEDAYGQEPAAALCAALLRALPTGADHAG